MRYAYENHSAMKAGLACVMVTALLGASASAHAARRPNKLRSVRWQQTGAATLVTLTTTARPTFTVYRMAGPDRVVVDLANTLPKTRKGIRTVGTWAVSSLAVSPVGDHRSSLTRVVITFRRACSYHIETSGSNVFITLTALDRPPADKSAQEAEAQARRADRLEAQARQLKQSEQSARKELARQRNMTKAARRELAKLRQEAERIKASERHAWQEFRRARKDADHARKAAQLAQQKANAAKRLAQRLRGSTREAQARIAWARAEIRAARLESKRAQAEAKSLKTRLAGLKFKARRLKIAAQEAQNRATRLKTKAARLAARAAQARWLAAQQQAAAQEAARYRAEAAQAKAENRRIRAELERLRIAAEQAKKNAARLRTTTARLAAQSAQARLLEAERLAAKEAARRYRMELERLKIEARQAKRKAAMLQTKTAQLAAQAAKAKLIQAERLAAERMARRYRGEITKARDEARRIRSELLRIKAEAAKARREALLYKSQSDRTTRRLLKLRTELDLARKDAAVVADKASRNQSVVSDYRRSATLADSQARRLARQLAILERKRRRMERQQKALRMRLATSQKEVAEAKRRAGVLSERLAVARQLVRQRESEVVRYKIRLRKLRRANGTGALRRRKAMEAELTKAKKRLAQAQAQYAAARRERDSSRKARQNADRTLKQLERQVAQREALLARLQKEAQQALKLKASTLEQKRLLERKVAALLGRYRSLQTLSEKVAKRHERLKRAYESLQGRLAQVRRAVNDELKRAKAARIARRKEETLARKAERQRSLLKDMQKEIARRRAQIAQLSKKLEGAGAREKRTVISGLTTSRKRLARLIRSVNGSRRRLARIEKQRRQAARRLSQARSSLDRARKKLEAADAERLKAQAAVRRTLAELQEIQQQKKREFAAKERLVQERTTEEKRLALVMRRRRRLEQASIALSSELKRTEQRLKAAERAQRAAQARLTKVHRALAAEENRRRQLLAENQRLAAKLRQARSMVRRTMRRKHPPRKRFAVRGKIYDVGFRDTGETHRVTVRIAGPFDYDIKRIGRKVFVEFYGVRLKRRLERSLDTSAFQGPVTMVSAYQERKTRGVVDLLVELGHASRFRVNRSRGALWIDFPKNSHPQMAQAKGDVQSARVGGYRSTMAMAPARPSSASPRSRWYRRRYGLKGHNLGPRVDLDFKDADIHNLLRLIGLAWKKNIVVSDDVQGKVTIRMVNVRAGRALEVILKSKGLGLVWEGRNIIRVSRQEEIQKEIEAYEKANQIKRKFEPVVMRVIRVAYADAAAIAKQLQDNVLSKRGKVTYNKRTNSIIIRDVAANIAIAKKLIRTLDTPTAQVVIEARIVEARSTFLREVGIQWGGNLLASPGTGMPTGLMFPFSIGAAGGAMDQVSNTHGIIGAGAANPNFAVNLPATVGNGQGGAMGFSFGTLGGAVNINLRLSAMEETGRVRIISSPRITTLDNVKATIQQGVRIPISVVSAQGVNTQFEEANLGLTVTPHVTSDGRVRLKIKVEKNEPDFVNTGARGDPTILKKSAETEMLVPDGDTAVIGGIYQRTTATSFSKVPWFADIPIIGWLFKNRKQSDERSEVLIFITPRVVKNTSTGRSERNRR